MHEGVSKGHPLIFGITCKKGQTLTCTNDNVLYQGVIVSAGTNRNGLGAVPVLPSP